jgi:hypothetical protein
MPDELTQAHAAEEDGRFPAPAEQQSGDEARDEVGGGVDRCRRAAGAQPLAQLVAGVFQSER